MKNISIIFIFILLFYHPSAYPQQNRAMLRVSSAGKGKINPMIDNIGYWTKMVKSGYVFPDTVRLVAPSRFTGTTIRRYVDTTSNNSGKMHWHSSVYDQMAGVPPQNSPDIPVTDKADVTQTENSLFIDPNDEHLVVNSNNSSSWISGYAQNPFGADALYSPDKGESWLGSTDGVNGNNNGDPSIAIGLNGWWYVGRITADNGQAVSYSKNQGKTWQRVKVGQGATSGFGILDKNHLWIDNSATSPYKGYLYDAWTNFVPGSADTNQIQIVRSADQGLTWTSPHKISAGVAAQKLNHGVNINSGPNGEVYVAWSIYDTWPSDEVAIGFTKSIDGGGIFTPATRIISNIKGIRATLTGKNMRVHSFPSLAVDNSTGPHRGTIYLVWPNVGYPGVNTGNDIDVYLIRSIDGGTSWSTPTRVNQDPPGLGKQHYFPWISCDPVTGGLCVIYYDDRSCDTTEVAAYVSYSYDGGLTWSDFQVSDNIFTPEPIPGLAFSYFGDYIGIQSKNMKVYPIWTDNHEAGRAMSYVSPFDLGPNPNQPWVMYHADSLSPVSGTGPSTLDYGDSLFLSVKLKNIGDQATGSVAAYLSTTSPYIIITDSISLFPGQFDPGQIRQSGDIFTIKVSDTIPDDLPVRFNLKVTSPDSVWYSHFSLKSHAPGMQIIGMTIIDTVDGNRNGRFDPGETVNVIIENGNSGDFPAEAAYARLSTLSPFLTIAPDSVMLGDLQPALNKKAVYAVSVSADAPVGTGTDMHYVLTSGLYSKSRSFRQSIGMLVEDWETNSFSKFPWQQGGTKPWNLTTQSPYEGTYCLRSGAVNDYQNSQFYLNYTSVANDSISFYVRTSSEQDYDYILFSIDAVWQGQWSGNTPWTRVAFPVAAGSHVFKWIYLKDLSFANGEDCAWVDFIALPPPVLPVVDPGTDDTICAGVTAALSATVQQADSLKWTTTGDGVFASDTASATTYFPGMADISAGKVSLRLTGYGVYGSTTREKQLWINPLPFAKITSSPADSACAGQTIELSCDSSNISTFHWVPGNYLQPVAMYDTANAGGMGSHQVILTVTGRNLCVNRDTLLISFKDCTGMEAEESAGVNISPNPGKGLFVVNGLPLQQEPIQFRVTNVISEVVYVKSVAISSRQDLKTIDLTFLPDGVYFLSIKAGQGTSVHKLVIRK